VVNLWSSRLRFFCKYYSAPKLAAARLLVRLGMQRKIRLALRNSRLTDEEREGVIAAYQKVIDLYSS
jgi:hypothetical protein